MKNRALFFGALGAGAGLMYLLDPISGRRRRALVRDKAVHLSHRAGDAFDATRRDVSNRAGGIGVEIRSVITRRSPTGKALEQQVRSCIRRSVSHPRAIDVSAATGRVTLTGPILADEVDRLLDSVSSLRGVEDVENRLQVHEHGMNIPGLQGAPASSGTRFELLQERWSPTARLLTGVVGGALALAGAARRGVTGAALALPGAALLLRVLANTPLMRVIGMGGGRDAVDIQKVIRINAPVDRVFDFWTRYENFPHFMSHVREVRRIAEDWSHWVVERPAGVPVEWDAVMTRLVPNRMMAWQTMPGSVVHHAGTVRFEPTPEGGTRVEIHMSYTPPAGQVGHVVADLLGGDPKNRMDQDLLQAKTLIETRARSGV